MSAIRSMREYRRHYYPRLCDCQWCFEHGGCERDRAPGLFGGAADRCMGCQMGWHGFSVRRGWEPH